MNQDFLTKLAASNPKPTDVTNIAQATAALYAQAFQDVVARMSEAMGGTANVVAHLRANAAATNDMADLVEAAMAEEDMMKEDKEVDDKDEKEKPKE